MNSEAKAYAELDIRLFRVQPGGVHVELRFSDPDSANQARRNPALGTAAVDPAELLALQLDPPAYGRKLAEQLFCHPDIRDEYAEALAVVEGRDLLLRLRLVVDHSAADLQGLRWELLRDPRTGEALTTSERILLFRFLFSQEWRPAKVRQRSDLTALVAVAAPPDLADYELGELDLTAEVTRARGGLDGIPTTVLGEQESATLERLTARLRAGVDILYLVCHGALVEDEPWLFLQDEHGKTGRVGGAELAHRIRDLTEPPRLVVLASCQGAGKADGSTRGALALRLGEAGVPAVVAMQGQVTVQTLEQAMPVFFAELIKDGQVDRALAVARGVVRERSDAWMPALYLRLKGGRIWYDAGFGDGEADTVKWQGLRAAVSGRHFTPIVGWGLAERIFGSPHDLAHRLAGDRCPLAPYQQQDLPMVFQYLQVDQSSSHYALESAKNQMRREILSRHRDVLDPELADARLSRLLSEAGRIARRQEEDPYRILAQLPATVYINASSDNLLEEALHEAGRRPDHRYPCWKSDLHPLPYDQEPTVENPLIYHIFGHLDDDESLVLTEDDYFDFLIGFSENRALVPGVVRNALSGGSLLFLGFELADWSFRVLYRLVMHQAGGHRRHKYTHAAVQVDPEGGHFHGVEQAKKYLRDYYGYANISIFWGSSEEFLVELHRQLGKAPEMGEKDEF